MFTVRIFMKCMHVCAAQKAYLLFIINKPDFPSLADEIAQPHTDMNIQVAAFTVSEKSSNTMNHTMRILSNQMDESISKQGLMDNLCEMAPIFSGQGSVL